MLNNFQCRQYKLNFEKIFITRDRYSKLKGKNPKKSVDWILEKKERRRQQGKKTCFNSKYTGRKRSGRF